MQFCRFSCQKSINAAATAADADVDVDVVAASWQASVAQAGRGTWPSYGLLLLANIQMQFMSSSPLLCTHDVSLAMIVVSRSVASCCWYSCCCCCCGFCYCCCYCFCCCCCCRSSAHKVAMPASWVWEFRFLSKRTSKDSRSQAFSTTRYPTPYFVQLYRLFIKHIQIKEQTNKN